VAVEETGEVRPSAVPPPLARVIEQVALAGGLIMLAAAILVCVSVGLRWATSNSVPGDFEMVQIAVALAAFAFLPYGQMRHSNIVVDSFTSWLPPRALAWLEAFWDLFYAFVAAFLAWRLGVGAAETIANKTTTMISGLPIGWAIAAASVLAGLLAVTAVATALVRIGRR
jgi:TRAP-type C4-dicarboxylate transport system permease small subunit